MSDAGNSPTQFLQSVLDWIIADVYRPNEMLREITRDAHAIERESRIQTTAGKFGMNCRQIVMGNTERILLLSFRSLFPDAITCDFAIDLGDENPIRPAVKRRANPFGINFRRRAQRHLWICAVPAGVVSECFFT